MYNTFIIRDAPVMMIIIVNKTLKIVIYSCNACRVVRICVLIQCALVTFSKRFVLNNLIS